MAKPRNQHPPSERFKALSIYVKDRPEPITIYTPVSQDIGRVYDDILNREDMPHFWLECAMTGKRALFNLFDIQMILEDYSDASFRN